MNWRRIFHKTWLWMILLGFNNCSRDRSSSQPLTGRALKVHVKDIYDVLYFYFFNVFSIFQWYILSHFVNRSTSALHLFALVFVMNVFHSLWNSYELDKVNIFIKGLTWYGFKTVFNSTFMYIYVVSRNTVISTQFRYKQLTTKIGYCGFLIFASSQFR